MKITEASIGQPVRVFYAGSDPYLKQFHRKTGVIVAMRPDTSPLAIKGSRQGLVELEAIDRPAATTAQAWFSERYLSPEDAGGNVV